HLDLGSDPNGLHIIANRADVDPVLRRNIVDSVARRLYAIDEDFCPAPPASIEGYAINSHQHDSVAFLAQPKTHLVPQQSDRVVPGGRIGLVRRASPPSPLKESQWWAWGGGIGWSASLARFPSRSYSPGAAHQSHHRAWGFRPCERASGGASRPTDTQPRRP